MSKGSLYHDDPDYMEWLNEVSKNCSCCPVCSDAPCDGVQGSGICDDICCCDESDNWDEQDVEENF